MSKIFNAIRSAVSAVWGFVTGDKAKAAIQRAVALVPQALPIVEMVALATPGKLDDSLVSLFNQYGIPWVEKWLSFPPEQRGMALLEASSQLLAKQFPGTPMNIINAAVQLAYTAWKAEQK